MTGRASRVCRALALLVAVGPGCKRSDPLAAEVPAEVDRVAFVALGGQEVLWASPVEAWSPRAALPLAAKDGVVLVGWSSAALAAAGVPAVLSAAPVTNASACGPRLPGPRWAAEVTDGTLTPRDPAALPALTVPGIEPRCPDLSTAELELEDRCHDARCGVLAVRDGCRYQLDLTSCGFGRISGSVDADGRMCLDFADSAWPCTPRPDDDTSSGPYACATPTSTCDLDVHLEVVPPRPPFELARLAAFPGEILVPGDYAARGLLTAVHLYIGRASGYAVRGDRVFVAGSSEGLGVCDPTRPAELRIFDADSFAQVATATAGGCVSALAPDPSGDGVLVPRLEPEASAWSLARFDRAGRLLATASSTTVSTGDGFERGVYPTAVTTFDDPPKVAVLFTPVSEHELTEALVVVHDARTLARLEQIPLATIARAHAIIPGGGSTLIIGPDRPRGVGWIDVRTRTLADFNEFPDAVVFKPILAVALDEPTGLVLAIGGGGSNLLTLRRREPAALHASLGRVAILTSGTQWPDGQHLVALAGTNDARLGPPRALLSFFELESLRFRPGVFDLGPGVAASLTTDERGRVWAMLPWSGEVLRLTPHQP